MDLEGLDFCNEEGCDSLMASTSVEPSSIEVTTKGNVPDLEYILLFVDGSKLRLKPQQAGYFGMVIDFGRAMASESTLAEIPMPTPFTKAGVDIIIGYLDMLTTNTDTEEALSKYFASFTASQCIAALNTAEFMIYNDFIKVCSVYVARKLKDLGLAELYQTCHMGDIRQNLEKFRYSPACWVLFGDIFREIFGKEPDWESTDSVVNLCL